MGVLVYWPRKLSWPLDSKNNNNNKICKTIEWKGEQQANKNRATWLTGTPSFWQHYPNKAVSQRLLPTPFWLLWYWLWLPLHTHSLIWRECEHLGICVCMCVHAYVSGKKGNQCLVWSLHYHTLNRESDYITLRSFTGLHLYLIPTTGVLGMCS